jgi:hypothetical protein
MPGYHETLDEDIVNRGKKRQTDSVQKKNDGYPVAYHA